jgi:uncharacterized protein YycO
MNYKEVMAEVKPGDVFVTFNRTNRFSKMIANVTRSDWSHVFMYVGNGNIVESGKPGVLISRLRTYFYGNHNVALLRHKKLKEEQRPELVEKVLAHVGKKYGRLQFVWYLFIRLIGQSENPRFQLDLQPNAMVCSEAIAYAYKEMKLNIKPYFRPAGTEPADFIESQNFEVILHGEAVK